MIGSPRTPRRAKMTHSSPVIGLNSPALRGGPRARAISFDGSETNPSPPPSTVKRLSTCSEGDEENSQPSRGLRKAPSIPSILDTRQYDLSSPEPSLKNKRRRLGLLPPPPVQRKCTSYEAWSPESSSAGPSSRIATIDPQQLAKLRLLTAANFEAFTHDPTPVKDQLATMRARLHFNAEQQKPIALEFDVSDDEDLDVMSDD